MVTKQEIEKLKRELKQKQMKIEELQEMRKLGKERKKLLRDIKKVRSPSAFVKRETTKRILRMLGRSTLKGAKQTLAFVGRLAEEDQRITRRMPRRRIKKRKRR